MSLVCAVSAAPGFDVALLQDNVMPVAEHKSVNGNAPAMGPNAV